jgi:LmbE family N-acetylglucosaminyl deacetylase
MSKRILCIHAHPDDAEILAAGTLALLREREHAVIILTMTSGDCGSHQHDPEEIAMIRRTEALTSAAVIGAEYHCAQFHDLTIFQDDHSRRRVVAWLRQTRPDIVLTASPVDYLCDHEATSALVRDACFAAPVTNYSTALINPAPPLAAIPHLYFVDPVGGVDRDGVRVEPDFIVNVGSTFEKKKTMLSKHESQRQWLLDHHGIDDYLNMMERWTRERGRQAGVEFGEGFRRYKGHPYPETPLLEELLGPDFVVAGNR